MSKNENDRRVVLSPKQKREIADLRELGVTYAQARWCVLTPEQRQTQNRQIRDAERRRYDRNRHREIIKRARNSANSARRRGAKRGAHEFTITPDDLGDLPTHCPVLGIELHYPGHHRLDPAAASLERINVKKGYVPGNVKVMSLRANLLRKDASAEELHALADYYLFDAYDPEEE